MTFLFQASCALQSWQLRPAVRQLRLAALSVKLGEAVVYLLYTMFSDALQSLK